MSAVQEADISRHDIWGREGIPETPQYHSDVMLRSFKSALYWSTMMSRDASFSDSYRTSIRCIFLLFIIIIICIYLFFIIQPDWKFYNDQAYSRPRDTRLSASLEPNQGPPETPQTSPHYMVPRGLREVLNRAPIMPRGGCSGKRMKFFPIYPQRNFFEILLNKTEVRLYLSFSDWFGTKPTSIWFQINRKIVNTIWFRFDLIRYRKKFSECIADLPYAKLIKKVNYVLES